MMFGDCDEIETVDAGGEEAGKGDAAYYESRDFHT